MNKTQKIIAGVVIAGGVLYGATTIPDALAPNIEVVNETATSTSLYIDSKDPREVKAALDARPGKDIRYVVSEGSSMQVKYMLWYKLKGKGIAAEKGQSRASAKEMLEQTK